MSDRYTFTFIGIATKSDKTRGISVGDTDLQVMLDVNEESAKERCTLERAKLVRKDLCSKEWETMW